jgi:hypothetical protein
LLAEAVLEAMGLPAIAERVKAVLCVGYLGPKLGVGGVGLLSINQAVQ